MEISINIGSNAYVHGKTEDYTVLLNNMQGLREGVHPPLSIGTQVPGCPGLGTPLGLLGAPLEASDANG